MNTRHLKHLSVLLALAWSTADAAVVCSNGSTTITPVVCTGPAQDMTRSFNATGGAFAIALSSESSILACGTTGAKTANIAAGTASLKEMISTYLTAFSLNRTISIRMLRTSTCTVHSITVNGNASSAPTGTPCPVGQPCYQ